MRRITWPPSSGLGWCHDGVDQPKGSVSLPKVKFSARGAAPGMTRPHAGGNLRWVVCTLLFFSVGINYLDRLVLSILKNDLSAALGWSEADYGWITAAFSFAYAFGYLLGGRFLDWVGVRR